MKNKKLFEERHHRAFKAKNSNKFNKGAKFKKPEENDELRIEDLQFLHKIKTGQLDNMNEKHLSKYDTTRPTELPSSENPSPRCNDGDSSKSVDLMTI